MRWIQKRSEPPSLTHWRARYAGDINFGYPLLRGDSAVVADVVAALLAEQGGLCAYTGRRIDASGCHIEHVRAQDHCTPGETVHYNNLLACYPAPNQKHGTPYGAEKKANWPTPSEEYLFVSPLDASCERRFFFNLRGEVHAGARDSAAATTIKKLGLDHRELTELRQAAIRGALHNDRLPIADARKRLRTLQSRHDEQLEPFCFALVQAMEQHIKRLEGIAKARKAKP